MRENVREIRHFLAESECDSRQHDLGLEARTENAPLAVRATERAFVSVRDAGWKIRIRDAPERNRRPRNGSGEWRIGRRRGDGQAEEHRRIVDVLVEILRVQKTGREKRIQGRFKLKAPCWVSPGNLSQREEFSYEGSTRDLSAGGLLAVFPRPLAVGDIYHLSFDRQVLDVPPVTARCIKCRMLEQSEDAFEVALAFFQAVEFPGSSEGK